MANQAGAVRPLNILMLLSNAFDPDPRVHREALALVEAGHRVTILCWDRDRKTQAEEMIDGIRLLRIYVDSTHGRGAAQMLYLFAFWAKALAIGRKLTFDVVHAHDFDTLPLGYALVRLKGARLVYDSHESYVDMVHTLPALLRRAIYHSENFLLKRADLVITVGDILKEHLQQRGARQICVVGNWQNPESFVFGDAQLRAEKANLGIRDGQKVIAFIANLGAERRVTELIEAVSQSPETYLILGGKGSSAELARQAAATFPNICYLGQVPPAKVPYYTALADIVFYGFDPDNPNARFSAPNKLFECLAAGKAMLTGDFGEIGRIVRDRQCGVILTSYQVEEMRAAIEGMTAEKLKQYGDNARTAGREKYSWALAAQTLLSNYRALQGGRTIVGVRHASPD